MVKIDRDGKFVRLKQPNGLEGLGGEYYNEILIAAKTQKDAREMVRKINGIIRDHGNSRLNPIKTDVGR